MTKYKSEDLAYLAGIIDGEGNISICRSEHKNRYTYDQRLQVTNTEFSLVSWLLDHFKGGYTRSEARKGNHRPVYTWFLAGRNSYKILRSVLSYLVIKREQADCAIELYEKVTMRNRISYNASGRYNVMPNSRRDLAEALYYKLKNLKAKLSDEEHKVIEMCFIKDIILEDFL